MTHTTAQSSEPTHPAGRLVWVKSSFSESQMQKRSSRFCKKQCSGKGAFAIWLRNNLPATKARMSLDVHKAELQPGTGQLGQRQATHGGSADALDAVERATQRSSSTSRFMAMMGSVVPRSRSGALVLIRHYFT